VSAVRRAARAIVGLALISLLAACGAGGFGSKQAAPADEDLHSYVALGDDFTAAPDTGKTVGDDGCLRSDVNYPALLAKDLGIDHVEDVSCTGATTKALTASSRPAKGKPKVPAQLDAVDRHTSLVTIGIGLLDRDLLSHVFQICTTFPCTDKMNPQTALTNVQTATEAVTSAIRAVQDRAPDAYIVVVGYPNITPASGSCDALPPTVDQVGLDTANILFEALNRQIRSAARETGAAYADISELSAGHELCSDDSWIRGGPVGRGGAVDYHPDAAEQKAVAAAVAELVKSR
jgi:hypothetical protein